MKVALEQILDYMRSQGYVVATDVLHMNIVYIEGMNLDGSRNSDTWDRWNDLRMVIDHDPVGRPVLRHCSVATTEPGRRPTFSVQALRRGGIFRIAFGQYRKCWYLGFHKDDPKHPALVQIPGAIIMGHRDRNRDGFRTGDLVRPGFGINQHGTRPGFVGTLVGYFSEGCLVGKRWKEHLHFIETVKIDARYQATDRFAFDTTVISGVALYEFISSIGKSAPPPPIPPKKPINTL